MTWLALLEARMNPTLRDVRRALMSLRICAWSETPTIEIGVDRIGLPRKVLHAMGLSSKQRALLPLLSREHMVALVDRAVTRLGSRWQGR